MAHPLLSRLLLSTAPLSTLPIRLAVGAVFIAHGMDKLFGTFNGGSYEATTQAFAAMGFYPAWLHAGLAGWGELLGGLFVFLGLFTRFGALTLAIIMIVAIITAHWEGGFFLKNNGFEYCLVLLGASLTLITVGPGRFSLDALLARSSMTGTLNPDRAGFDGL